MNSQHTTCRAITFTKYFVQCRTKTAFQNPTIPMYSHHCIQHKWQTIF